MTERPSASAVSVSAVSVSAVSVRGANAARTRGLSSLPTVNKATTTNTNQLPCSRSRVSGAMGAHSSTASIWSRRPRALTTVVSSAVPFGVANTRALAPVATKIDQAAAKRRAAGWASESAGLSVFSLR